MNDGWKLLEQRFAALGDCKKAIPDMLSEAAAQHGDRDFVRFGDEITSYAAFDNAASQLATGLDAVGVKKGDRIAFLTDSRIEVLELLFAGWRIGAIGVPLNVFLRGKPLEHQLTDSGSDTLVVDGEGFSTALALVDRLPKLRRIVLLDEMPDHAATDGIEVMHIDDLRSEVVGEFEPRANTDPALIMYTSGTTGLPKGCVLAFRYLYHVGREWTAVLDINDEDVFFSVAPLYHFGGIIPVMATLVSRISINIEPSFKASQFIARAVEVGATLTIGVGWLVVALLAQPETPADRKHRLRVMMATPVSETDREKFEARFGIELLSEVFGQTECTLGALSTVGGSRKSGSAGRAAPWHELGILDENDCLLPPGEVGEIAIRPRVPGATFDGYWNRPADTAAASTTYWHHTGDIGTLDHDGYLTFVDRKSDRLRRRGENIASFEIESVVMAHDAIAEAAVHAVSIPGEVDDTLKACIVLAPGATLEPGEIAGYFATELPYYAIPRFVEVFEELPRNASGRVMKFELRKEPQGPNVWDLQELQLTVGRDKRRG
jgi:crotonobetaine/carnitine-CoA ligase